MWRVLEEGLCHHPGREGNRAAYPSLENHQGDATGERDTMERTPVQRGAAGSGEQGQRQRPGEDAREEGPEEWRDIAAGVRKDGAADGQPEGCVTFQRTADGQPPPLLSSGR